MIKTIIPDQMNKEFKALVLATKEADIALRVATMRYNAGALGEEAFYQFRRDFEKKSSLMRKYKRTHIDPLLNMTERG